VPNDALQLETERQNRIYQEALELKRLQARTKETCDDQQPANEDSLEASTSMPLDHAADSPPSLSNVILSLPDLRIAFYRPDENGQTRWSKPFLLSKLDMEPWLSYFNGYRKSRLFLERSIANGNDNADENSELHIDFAVRALFDLKRIDAIVILDPLVQISGHVEYVDLDEEVRTCRTSHMALSLAESGHKAHRKQLETAFAKGLQLGNELHEALLGEGLVHLIAAWENICGRKPTIEELHLMLTTRRIKIPTGMVEVATADLEQIDIGSVDENDAV
jgi:hypothetical protein